MNALIRNLISRMRYSQGNIMVYIAMLLVIFGVLGVTMVSLFTTSVTSSATQNDTRRAISLSESGIRYAASELRANDFSESAIATLNDTDYTLSPSGQFNLNIFSNWFDPTSSYDTGTQLVDVNVPEGELPEGYLASLPAGNPDFLLVNFNSFNPLSADSQSSITGLIPGSATSFQFQLADDLVAHGNEQVALAVTPFSGGQDIPSQGFLDVKLMARNVFPKFGGAFTVGGGDFYYMRVDPTITDRVRLMGVTRLRVPGEGGAEPPDIAVAEEDPVILSPMQNRLVVSEGRSGLVRFGNTIEYAAAIVDNSFHPKSRKPDIEFDEEADLPSVLRQVEQNTGVVNVYNDPGDKYLSLSASGGSFGAVWFQDTRSIGGLRNFCQTGGCLFNAGFRAFFIMNFSGADGDGFTFSILNRSNNDIGSVGGDINLSELMGYAGDSRTVSCPSLPSGFLDGQGKGLQPPKIALEFDGKASNQSAAICAVNECINSASVNQGSRFDPSIDGVDRDAVQYVFWGSNNDLINALCRVNRFLTPNTNKTYDDNRHDTVSEVWRYNSGSRSLSSPAVDDSDSLNIRIYTGRSSENVSGTNFDRGRFNRHRPSDGTTDPPGWTRNPDTTPGNDDDIDSSPALDVSSWTDFRPPGRPYDNGTPTYSGDIFIGNDAFYLSKYNSSGTPLWSARLENDDNIEGKPAVTSNDKNRVYVVGDTGTLYSLNKSTGVRQWAFDIFIGSTSEDFTSSPVVIEGSGSNPNVIFVGSLDNALYAVQDNSATAAQVFRYTRAGGPIRSTPAVNPVSGDIYFGSDDNRVYAVTNTGADRWVFVTGNDVVSSPAVSPDGTRLYIGSDDGYLYALNTQNGNRIWRYRTSGNVRSSPTVATDGVVYFGSDDGHLYALNPNDGSLRWQYPPPGATALERIRCKPAVGPDGIVYFTTEDATEGRLFAVEPAFNDPPNDPGIYLTPTQLDPAAAGSYSNNWLTLSDAPNGWAVRLEVERSLSPNASGNYEYTLKTWMKKCEDEACSNVTGRFFQNTRFQYDWAGETIPISPMTQTIELSNTSTPPPGQLDFLHDRFDRFLFGFTSASTAPQTIEIRKFQLSFIRPNDPLAND